MRKYLLFIVFALALVSCGESNKLIGTWVKSESSEVSEGGNVGLVSVLTIKADGTFEEKHELQAGVKKDDFSIGFTISGKWEMLSEDKFIFHSDKAIINGKEMENKIDEEYTIIKVDDENMEFMNKGRKYIYVRKK